jgi:hypothetical protein
MRMRQVPRLCLLILVMGLGLGLRLPRNLLCRRCRRLMGFSSVIIPLVSGVGNVLRIRGMFLFFLADVCSEN